MLTLYRSNRAEFLAAVLARQLLEDRPGPFDTVEVLVNTWPTSRWLGEQLAVANGISSLVRFPFPGSRLRQLVRQVLDLPEREDDPWRATTLVWSVLELLPHLLDQPQAAPLRDWLNRREPGRTGLTRDRWQLARAIADALDDYALYRPEVLRSWLVAPETTLEDWQPLLVQQLAERLARQPFGLQVHQAVDRLRSGQVDPSTLPPVLRLFGISALAPVQVELVQALSGSIDVQVYLLTPCRDLWQRVGQFGHLLLQALAKGGCLYFAYQTGGNLPLLYCILLVLRGDFEYRWNTPHLLLSNVVQLIAIVELDPFEECLAGCGGHDRFGFARHG